MDYDQRLAAAVRHFWEVRTRQSDRQGATTGKKDAGNRGAVTGGKHLDGFIRLVADALAECGLPEASIHSDVTTLPGYFRPTKNWDLVVVDQGRLVATIEFKAHVGPSFGNNFNNRVEEALGSSTDLLTAYREGKFQTAPRPWLGWLMLLEESPRSIAPVRAAEPHFEVFKEFRDASYAKRYAQFCERLMRERLYDAACLLLSDAQSGLGGAFREPSPSLDFRHFLASLTGHARAHASLRPTHGEVLASRETGTGSHE